jgi:hypothetical protein
MEASADQPKRSRLRITGIIILSCIAVYAILGFFLAPSILTTKLTEGISSFTGGTTTLEDLSVNPFTLSVELTGLELNDRNGENTFGVRRLFINYQLRSLFTGAVTFAEIAIDSPHVNARLDRDGSLNLRSMMPESGGDTSTSGQVQIVIDQFTISGGSVVYEDRTRSEPIITRINSLGFALHDFTTQPLGEGTYQFLAATARAETLAWKGTLQLTPFRSAGSIRVTGLTARTIGEYLQGFLNASLTSGELGLAADYQFDASTRPATFRITNGSIAARSFTVHQKEIGADVLVFPVLDVAGMRFDMAGRSFGIGSITSTGAKIAGVRFPDETNNLTRIIVRDSTADTGRPWNMLIEKMHHTGATFSWLDSAITPPAAFGATRIDATIDTMRPGTTAPVRFRATSLFVPDSGTVALDGDFRLDPISARMKVRASGISLKPFQPYLALKVKMEMKSGDASCNGTFSLEEAGNGWKKSFTGNAWSEGFRATDTVMGEDFLRWGRLDLKSMVYSSTPPLFTVEEIVATRPFLRFLIDTLRTTNLHHIMVEDSLARDSTVPPEPPMTSRIGMVRIVDGSMNFADMSLRPAFETGIQELTGSISGMSSSELTRATIDLNGKVDRYAPVTISGQINPLSEVAYTDVKFRFENVELSTFSPYFTKFAGYKIDKGKLLLDLQYKLNKDELEGENKIILDQLTLGEAVEGPDVTSIPVRLAIALLKDSKGVIDIDLPVSGNINDPEFSLAPIVWKALLNLVIKAVTSPFKLLGALIGGSDEDLSYVAFAPGIDILGGSQKPKLEGLAKSLNERPELVLDIRGTASDSLDREMLKEFAVQKKLGVRPRTEWTPEERKRIAAFYKETFKLEAIELVSEKSESGQERSREERDILSSKLAYAKLVDAAIVGEEEIRSLARNRATAVKDALIGSGGVAAQRIFLLDVETASKAEDGEIRLPLTLDAR